MNTLQTKDIIQKIERWNLESRIEAAAKTADFPLDVEGVQPGAAVFFIRAVMNVQTAAVRKPAPVAVVVPTDKDAEALVTDLESAGIPVSVLPWWGTMAYRPAATCSPVFGNRARTLASLALQQDGGNAAGVVVMTQRAFLMPVPPPDYIRRNIFLLKKGGAFDSAALTDTLVLYGYIRVPRVTLPGEFSLRGEVLDIFMPGDDIAYRVVFDFDAVETIRTFETIGQSSIAEIPELAVYPVKETLWTEDRIAVLAKNLEAFPEFKNNGEDILAELMVNQTAAGEELYFPLAFDGISTVMDYIPEESTAVYIDYDRQCNLQESLDREYAGLYRNASQTADVPRPERLIVPFKPQVDRHVRTIKLRTLHGEDAFAAGRLILKTDPPRSFFGNINYFKEELNILIKNGWDIVICAGSEPQTLRIAEILKDFEVSVFPGQLATGFGIPELKFMVIQENEIFGRRRHIPKSVKHAKSAVIDTFIELNPGDYVVHVNYGIGRFKGIERVKAMGNERDYIQLEYADDETVFIPIEQANLVQRYIGNEGNTPALDILGSKSWENRKNRVSKVVEDIAEKLIALYSRRKASQGFAFPPDTEWQAMFEAAFPYEETEDQLTCAAEVKADMEKPQPMDRLVCGDVGYGKTEIALRAAFKAVMGGKQVAFLAPTTILAEQHFENMQERFRDFPVRIGHLSRFVPRQEQKAVLEKTAAGAIDILIGTHRIIQKDVKFKDLGLMIIDEEQRFGVKDKERLKELKTNIDALALSATPIPRTLHMSLLKIRDMSLLTTPPRNRHPVETVIAEFNADRIAAAIRRESERGGQVFYLHNRVDSLDDTRLMLERLVPEMMVETAHGQMSSQELDDIFRRFKMGGFQVLVSTTIIENGIDIPNVNTIIIDRADMYGVSQLYQLRGRVGRSDRTAFAYLLYPQGREISEIAMKRLQVISDFTDLGSGFKIAMKDMEIRGAGNLLGKEQSGDICSVGFDLYLQLLEQAVQKLSTENYRPIPEPLLELEYTGFIPASYIPMATTKMEIYKKIAAIGTRDELERVYNELSDRFGPIPDEVRSLLALAEIRIICKKTAINSLKERKGEVQIEFGQVSNVSVERVLRMMQESAGRVKLDPRRPNILLLKTGNIGLQEKSEFIREKLEALSAV